MNGAEELFKALIDAGLDTCFAIPALPKCSPSTRWGGPKTHAPFSAWKSTW